jgi:hypothetical protein
MSEHEQEQEPTAKIEVGGDAVVIPADQVNVEQPKDNGEEADE